MRQDLYTILGVPHDASTQDIESAFTQRMGVAADNNARVVLRHAREVLADPVARTAYDTRLRATVAPTSGRASARATVIGDAGHDTNSRWGLLLIGLCVAVGVAWWLSSGRKPTVQAKPMAPAVVVHPSTPAVERTQPVGPRGQIVSGSGSPEAVYASVAPSVVLVAAVDTYDRVFSRGSGVAVGGGQIVTNCHVIEQAVQIRVRQGSTEYLATPSTSDTYLDLCMLNVPQFSGPAVARISVKSLRVGQTVYAVGAPYGLERTLSQGLVSALRDTAEGTVIQTSAAISPGSSGGGLFDAQGQLVGITTFQTKSGQNLNFAVPADWLDTMRTR